MFKAVVRQELLPTIERAEAMVADSGAPSMVLLQQLAELFARIVGSRLSAIPKLVLTEAGNFPDLARFYLEEVVDRGKALFRKVLERGVAGGEFRPIDTESVVLCVIAPLLLSALWRHSFEPHARRPLDTDALCRTHLDLLRRGLADKFTWRWVFLLNVPVGILLSLLAGRVLADPPELVTRRKARLGAGLSLDYVGLALLVPGMGALQIVLDKGQEDDWFASTFITRLFILAAASLLAFVVWELRRADPIVDLRLLADRNFAVGNLLMFVLGFVLLASTALLPLFVQSLLGYTATDAGLVISPGGFALMLIMPLVGALSAKIDARWLIATGFAGCALALYSMTRFNAQIDYGPIAWARIHQSLPPALLFIPINTAALAAMPSAKSNNASAIINMMHNIGGSVGISVATTLIVRCEQYHQSVLVEHVTSLSSQYDTVVHRLQQAYLAYSGSAVDALHQAQAQAQVYAMVQRQAALLSSVILALMVPLVLLMRKPRPGAAPPLGH